MFSFLNISSLSHELHIISYSVFLIGLVSFLESKDFLNILINIEIMMLGISFYTLTTSILLGDYMGQLYVLCFLAVSAAETVIGLSLVVLIYRTQHSLVFNKNSIIK